MTLPPGALHAVVLAAGAGRRFGGGKLLGLYKGRSLIEAALATAAAAPVAEIIVVVGAEADRVEAAVGALPMSRPVRIVRAERWADGMSASLGAGVAALPRSSAGAFVFLGDMPEVPLGVLEPLGRAVLAGASAAAPTHRGRRGHPVVLGAGLLSKVSGLSGDAGARALLEELREGLALVDTPDAGVLLDVDVKADLVTGWKL